MTNKIFLKNGTREVQLTDLFENLSNMNIRVDGSMLHANQISALQDLQEKGCMILLPKGSHFKINLTTDPDTMIRCESVRPKNRKDCTDMYFLSTPGGMNEWIRGLVDFARFYDSLFEQQKRELPTYEFVSEDGSIEDIDEINKMFSEVIALARSGEEY